MKDFTSIEELEAAPAIIQHIYMCRINRIPFGLSTYQEAMRSHPEYFEEEIERINILETIPQEVKDAYNEELDRLRNELIKPEIPRKGILYWAEHPDECRDIERQRDQAYEEQKDALEKIKRDLHDKYLKPYGLQY